MEWETRLTLFGHCFVPPSITNSLERVVLVVAVSGAPGRISAPFAMESQESLDVVVVVVVALHGTHVGRNTHDDLV